MKRGLNYRNACYPSALSSAVKEHTNENIQNNNFAGGTAGV
jgi:hypothetical protein